MKHFFEVTLKRWAWRCCTSACLPRADQFDFLFWEAARSRPRALRLYQNFTKRRWKKAGSSPSCVCSRCPALQVSVSGRLASACEGGWWGAGWWCAGWGSCVSL